MSRRRPSRTHRVRPQLLSFEDRCVPAVFVANGADPASIQATVDNFRAALGTNNGVGGTFADGRREINWDGVPDAKSAPNNLPGDFFNVTSPRGALFGFGSGSGGTGFQVSGKTGVAPVRFDNLNATYSTTFQTFSAERLFTPLGDNTMEVSFRIPGTTIPAFVTGFGAVFTDVDGPGTIYTLIDPDGKSLGQFAVPASPNGGLSFLGLTATGTEKYAKIIIQTGSAVIGTNDAAGNDIVVMDDFIYGEPQAIDDTPPDFVSGSISKISVTDADVGGTVVVTMNFNEPLDSAKVPTITGNNAPGTLVLTDTTVTGSSAKFTFTIADGNEEATSFLVINGITDLAGNVAPPETLSVGITVDTKNPTVTIEQAVDQTDPTSAGTIFFTATFDGVYTGFSEADVILGGTANPASVAISNPGGDGKTFRLAISGMNQSGTVTVAIAAGAVNDTRGNPSLASTSVDNSVFFNPNIPPLISDIGDLSVPFGGFSTLVPFFVGDADEAAANLIVTASSGSPTLVADKGVVFGGSGTNRTLVIAPSAGQTGTAVITVTVTDSLGATATDTFTVTVDAPPALPAPPTGVTVQEAAGADAASIQAAVDAFRTLLGGNNGVGGPVFTGGRREINWDGVPETKENPFPGDFFNVNSPRGVLLSTDGDRLQVSGAVGTAGFEFADVTAQQWGPIEFSSFSSPKLFAPIGSTTYDVEFRLPGTNIPAGVRAFGTVFTDVDLANVSKLEFFDAQGNLILSRDVLPTGVQHEGLSFLGVQLPEGQLAAKVRVTTGTAPIDSPFQFPPPDGVAVDDFIYSEPEALPAEVITDIFAVGTGPGVEAQVNVFNADGSFRFALFPFGSFRGGVTVATGDVNGDGFDDIAVGAGPGGGPHVRVFDGVTAAPLRSFFAYDPAFSGGVFVGLGDVTGDLRTDIVTGAGAGGGPHVKVFDSQSLATVHSFFAFAPTFRGGVNVRAGDVDGDGFADIVTGAGPGGGPHIKVFNGRDLSVLQSFFAGDPNSRAGVFVGVANLRGTSSVEVVGSASGSLISRGYIEQENVISSFNPGVIPLPVATVRFNGIIAILIGAAPGTGSTVNIVDGTSNTIVSSFNAFPSSFTGGVFVG